jgi:hypothetical protein
MVVQLSQSVSERIDLVRLKVFSRCMCGIALVIHSVVCLTTGQVHSLLQSEFSTECIPLSLYSILLFPYDHPAAAYVFFFVFP